MVSNYCFDILMGDAFSNKQLREFVKNKGYEEVHLCGIDECGCVTATALGAAKIGLRVKMLSDGMATIFSQSKVDKVHKKWQKAGISF